MRPSQYHYIKRMWIRNIGRRRKQRSNSESSESCIKSFGKIILFALFAPIIIPITILIIPVYLIATWAANNNRAASKNISENYADIVLKLNRSKHLAEIVNHTSNRQDFETSLSELKGILSELSQYEKYGIFREQQPSQALKNILDIESEQRRLFYLREAEETRKAEKKKHSSFDIDAFARMCNAYLEHQDEMEQYTRNGNSKGD